MDTRSTREPLLTWWDGALLGTKVPGGGIIDEVTIKLRRGGQLAVISKVGPDDFYVAFTGAGEFLSLLRKIRNVIGHSETRWRLDDYKKI